MGLIPCTHQYFRTSIEFSKWVDGMLSVGSKSQAKNNNKDKRKLGEVMGKCGS